MQMNWRQIANHVDLQILFTIAEVNSKIVGMRNFRMIYDFTRADFYNCTAYS